MKAASLLILAATTALLLLSACGQKGALVLPDAKPESAQEQTNQQPEPLTSDQQQ